MLLVYVYIIFYSFLWKKRDKMIRLMNVVNEIWVFYLNLSYNILEGEGKKSNVGLVWMKWENLLIVNF